MRYSKFKSYEFMQAISGAIDATPSMIDFLNQLPGIIEKYLPVKQTVVFYRGDNGKQFQPYPGELGDSPIAPLDEQSDIIRGFVTHQRAVPLDSKEDVYYEIFNRNSHRLLDRFHMNLLLPLHCRGLYRGLMVCRMDLKKKGSLKEVEEIVRTASHIFIPIIETERLAVENDRNYYRLFKFDRLVLLGEMVAAIAHELRTPMNTILLEIQEMNDRLKEKGQKDMTATCQKIKGEIQRVNQFIRSLLNFSRFKEMAMENLALNDFVRQSLAEVPKRRIPVNLEMDAKLECTSIIPIDRNRLRQVFFNILFNAFDAAGENGKVTIRAYSEAGKTDKKTRYFISIHDNGPGIPDEIKERILEPFFTTKEDGTGLGMYISQGIMNNMKGTLEINNSGEGTTVNIILPGD
ncbi:MAG: hypothetical protein GY940_39230 [bacterium]|nr:hypothetical protein [bacterium]